MPEFDIMPINAMGNMFVGMIEDKLKELQSKFDIIHKLPKSSKKEELLKILEEIVKELELQSKKAKEFSEAMTFMMSSVSKISKLHKQFDEILQNIALEKK